LQASGALESAGATSALMGPSSGRGGCESKNWWFYKECKRIKHQQYIVKRKHRMKYFFRLQVAYLWQRVRGVKGNGQTRRNFYFCSEGSQWSNPLVEILFL
jgi:hypothetical protein